VKYLLDTNMCVFVIRQKSQLVLQRLRQQQAGDVGISTVTLAELRYGADKSNDPSRNNAALDAFLVPLETVEFNADAADEYGQVRSDLGRRGLPIGPLDATTEPLVPLEKAEIAINP
jgi:tRNA(fMet)-specific endonuclease VapC